MALDATKGMEDLATFNVREVKRAAAEEREGMGVFLCRRTVRIKVKSKVIPASFLKIKGWGTSVGAKDQRKKDGW